jgi:uncharacterized protein (DUF2267 family)
VLFPVLDADLARRLREEILAAYLKDNLKARFLQADGTYIRAAKNGQPFSAQDHLMEIASELHSEPPVAIAPRAAVKRAVSQAARNAEARKAEAEMTEIVVGDAADSVGVP